jgi:hypothetical protein
VHVRREWSAHAGLKAGVVDRVEKMLEGAGDITDVGRRAEQVAVGLQRVDGARRQSGTDDDLDSLDGVVTRTSEDRLEHLLGRRRRGVMDDEQASHDRILPGGRA